MNSLLLDEQFLRQISSRLEKFKQVSPHRFNCRCPICGDSKRNKSKARFHAFQHNTKGFLVCKCFNCGYTNSFDNFLREIDPEFHKMYLMEKFRESNNNIVQDTSLFVQEQPAFDTSPLKKLKKVSQLPVDHPVKLWVVKRGIPPEQHYRLYLTGKFKAWTNKVLPGKFEDESNDEPRLIIPILDYNGNMFGFQGRAFSKSVQRYITIMLDKTMPKLFGLDTVDLSRTVYCVEGPIDSLFVNNAIASCGGSIVSDLQWLKTDKSNIVVVYDNEPRNKDIVNNIEKAIESGYNVCIWPEHINEKDINDMYLAGMSRTDIKRTIDDNTYNGLEAKLRMTQWKKTIQ